MRTPQRRGSTPEGEEGLWLHSPRQKPSRGRRGGCGGSHDDFPGVEISMAGGVGEMIRDSLQGVTSFLYISFISEIFFRYTQVWIASVKYKLCNLTCFSRAFVHLRST